MRTSFPRNKKKPTLIHSLHLKLFYRNITINVLGTPLCKTYSYQCVGYTCVYLFVVYVAFNSQSHIATGSLQVEETSAYCAVNHRPSASNYQLSNMKRPALDSNWRPQWLEARTLTATPPSPLHLCVKCTAISVLDTLVFKVYSYQCVGYRHCQIGWKVN